MRINNILTVIVILFGLSGCATGPATYEIFQKNLDMSIGDKLYPGLRNKDKKTYDKNHYIYILEYPKNCIFGYIVKKNDPEMKIVSWKIISGKKYCKEREETVLIQ